MSMLAIDLPDAKDMDSLAITPRRELRICNDLLDDREALNRFYEDNGYLFFRHAFSPASIARARDEMLAIAADKFGIVKPGDATAQWTGKPLENFSEEGPEFSGISKRLVEDPSNQAFLGKIMGENASMVPIVQYRIYPPGGPVTPVHQDGFYSPGIEDYRPVWTVLVDCPRNVGGLMLAVGEHKRGYFHNGGKAAPFPIPEGFVDPDSWATADYEAGDVLIVHPYTPHAAMPNTSGQLRVTLDTRIQSAANPAAFSGRVVSVTPNSITLDADDPEIGRLTLSVDKNTYIRVRDRSVRENFADFASYTVPGMHLLAVRNGERATTLRCGTNP